MNDKEDINEINDNNFVVFLRTILTILENHNFKNTAASFKNECKLFGFNEVKLTDSSCQTESKLPPKIIFENFSNSEPYRIIFENNNNGTTESESEIPENYDTNKNFQSPIEIKIEAASTDEENRNLSSDEKLSQDSESTKLEKEKHNFDQNGDYVKTKVSSQLENSRQDEEIENKSQNNDYEILKDKFCSLQIEHQKLMNVVTELTFALQTSIKGHKEETHMILNNCEKIYPELFCNKPLKSSIKIVEKNVNKESENNSKLVNTDLKLLNEIDSSFKPCFNLDFQKIKHDLKNGELNTKLLLLQALRWRITKTPKLIREGIIRTYIRHDILNVHSCSHRTGFTYPKNSIVFTSFYCSCKSPQTLQQAVTRLVNAFTSVKLGRDYIVHQSVILNILLSVMLGTHPSTPAIDDITRDMIIATLQKISLRYSSRMAMISEGLTEHITKFLASNFKSLNDYCLEYSSALLRNLWLHSEAREKCHPIAQDVLKILATLLQEQYFYCLPYIIGSLYNLLPDHYYHKAAKSINLEEILLYRIDNLDGEMKEQLQYILEIYLNPNNWEPLCECNLGTDSENEIDVIEPEIDQNETIQLSGPSGEQILFNYRMTYSFDASDINPNVINNIFSIPVTPNATSHQSSKNHSQQIESQNVKQIPEIDYLEYAAQFLNERMTKKIFSITNQTEYKEIQMEENVFYDKEEHSEVTDNEVRESEIEMSFCEDTQQLYYAPSKDGIFEPDKIHNLHSFSPSFLKNIGEYDIKNISKSLPVSPRNKNIDSTPSTAQSGKVLAQYLSPTANFSGLCYRDGLKQRSYSDSSTPHIGFCNEDAKANNIYNSKYSCACFAEMQRSFEEESKKSFAKNSNEKISNIAIQNDIRQNEPNLYCKYKCYPTSNSAPTQSSPKKERAQVVTDSGGSKSLDETDYTSVFESRPRILRTP